MATFSCNSIVGSLPRASALVRACGQLQHTRAKPRLPIPALALLLLLAAGLIAGGPLAHAQYPGHIDTAKPRTGSTLRAVAVLEFTGPPGKPTASRLIPITVYDGSHLHDGSLYLTQPTPLALQSGTEYEMQSTGQPIGLFDLRSASHRQLGDLDSWLGFGLWKPLPKPAPPAFNASGLTVTGLNEDTPVLLRKHAKTSASSPSKTATSTQPGGSGPAGSGPSGSGPVDPDRPTLHHLPTAASSGTAPAASSASGPDANSGPLRETGLNSPDPNRPRLTYGKPKNLPSAAAELQAGEIEANGAPNSQLQQIVAVSDPNPSMPHPFTYSWANPFDQANARRALESIARTTLAAPVRPAPASSAHTSAHSSMRTTSERSPLTAPLRIAQESFRSFELEYGAAPTMVFTAATPPLDSTQPDATSSAQAPQRPAPQRYVTLVAQPDIYGNPIVLLRSVADSAHLDQTPRLRLIDAVDPTGNNRASLLFELLGNRQRRFALYTLLNGTLQRTFTTIPQP